MPKAKGAEWGATYYATLCPDAVGACGCAVPGSSAKPTSDAEGALQCGNQTYGWGAPVLLITSPGRRQGRGILYSARARTRARVARAPRKT